MTSIAPRATIGSSSVALLSGSLAGREAHGFEFRIAFECKAFSVGFESGSKATSIERRRIGEPEVTMTIQDLLQTIATAPITKRAITNPTALNEAFNYAKPSSFSRGIRIDLNDLAILLISGTASIDEHGNSVHIGDIRAQCFRTFQNITALLLAEGATWKDIVRTSCYLRDIDRDYEAFNEERTAFFKQQALDPLPASTGIQAKLCRPELLVEIEAIAMFRQGPKV
jgi:2-iminobutanoate/2-iminopropanoate deaminase